MAALAKERSLWLSRPDRLIRAARHYEGAAQILIRHAVMTAKEVSERRDTYCVVLLGHGMGVQDKGTICSQNSALEAFLVCRCSTSPGNTLQVKHLQHCQTHQNLEGRNWACWQIFVCEVLCPTVCAYGCLYVCNLSYIMYA